MNPSDQDDSKSPEFEPRRLTLSAADFGELDQQQTSLFADTADEPVLNIDEQEPVYRGVMDPPALSYGAHNNSGFGAQDDYGRQGFAGYHDSHELDNQGFGSLAHVGFGTGAKSLDALALDNFSGFNGFNDFDSLDLSHLHANSASAADIALDGLKDVTISQPATVLEDVPDLQDLSVLRELEQSHFNIDATALPQAIQGVQEYLQQQEIDFQWDAALYTARCESLAGCINFHIRVLRDSAKSDRQLIVEFQRRSGCVMAFNQVVQQCRQAVQCSCSHDHSSTAPSLSQWDDCGMMLDTNVDLKSLGALAPPSFAAWGAAQSIESSDEEDSSDLHPQSSSPIVAREPLESSAIESLLSLLLDDKIDMQSDAAHKLALLSSCPASASDLWGHHSGLVLRCVETLCGIGSRDMQSKHFAVLPCSDLDVQRGRVVRHALATLANIAQHLDSSCRQCMIDSPLLAILQQILDTAHCQLHADLRRQSARLLSHLSASHGSSLASMLPLLRRTTASTSDVALQRSLEKCVSNVQNSGGCA